LKDQASSIKGIGHVSGLKYAVVLYHLRLLEEEKVIQRNNQKKPYLWSLTGLGQKRLTER
jgi:predicted transcriptional regulator